MDINKWLPVLVDPDSKTKLVFTNENLTNNNGKQYPLQNNKPVFLNISELETFEGQKDSLDKFKTKLKNLLGKYYNLLNVIISPALFRIHWGTLSNYFSHYCKQNIKDRPLAIQIGSGNHRIDKDILNIDIFDYVEVDMVADCTKLPFADNSIDCVIHYAVLEHIIDPEVLTKEAARVLKPGGLLITGVPFIVGYHASPDDYTRWTDSGLESLHERYGIKKKLIEPICGPTSAFLWIFQEWLSILLSFNIKLLYMFWWYVFLIVLLPFKLLDILLIYYKEARKIAFLFMYVGIKKPATVQ